MTSSYLDHLIFSTRAAKPESGTDFNRGVVASSRDVSGEVRSRFSAMADITGSVLGEHELPAIHSFSKVDGQTWLFSRAVSLGYYRKRSHQLLVHGVVLGWEHLDWLEGNPFVLARCDLSGHGFAFHKAHPGDRGELEKLKLDYHELLGLSRSYNQKRFAELSRELEAYDEGFARLYDLAVRHDGCVACIDPERPDEKWIEWLLLHFHPHDRTELSFNTRYSYEHPVEYDLLLASESDRGLLRQHFRDRLRPWNRPSKKTVEESISDEEDLAATSLGALVERLRRESPEHYSRTLENYHLTHWVQDQDKPAPLSFAEVRICLLYELDPDLLTPSELDLWNRLEGRALNNLTYHVHHMANRWKQGMAAFEGDLAKLEARARKVDPAQLPDALARLRRHELKGDGWAERWALAVLLRSDLLDGDPSWARAVLGAWLELVPPHRFPEFLAFLSADEQQADSRIAHAEALVESYLEEAAREEAAGGAAAARPAYWPDYLRWRVSRGLPLPRAAARIERVIDGASEEVLQAWSPLLQEICFDAGLPAFAYRLLFGKQVPRLRGDALQACVDRGVVRLLGESSEEDAHPKSDVLLQSSFGDPRIAGAVLRSTADWLRGHEDPETAWNRWLDLFEQQGEALTPEAIPEAGRFLAQAAASRLGGRFPQAWKVVTAGLRQDDETRELYRDELMRSAAEVLTEWASAPENSRVSPHLPLGLYGLLEARCQLGAETRVEESVDEQILELLLRGVVHMDHVRSRIRRSLPEARPQYEFHLKDFRASWKRYLGLLLELKRFPRLAASPRLWQRLLLDELICRPPEHHEADVRYRAYMHVSWLTWSREPGPRSEVALRRMLPWEGGSVRASWSWHRELIEKAVSEGLVPKDRFTGAQELLT